MSIDHKVDNRVMQISNYLDEWNINNVVIGMSGGIDSAFTFEILREVQKYRDITIHTMFFKHGLHEYEADSNIVEEYVNGKAVHLTVDLSSIINQTNLIDNDYDKRISSQYAYALMYTMLFRRAQQVKGITFGTTNADEFSIGWFGKNSDMVVDIQPIIDFHKIEIYDSSIVKNNVPDSILKRAPNGDLITGLSDEEIFGCTYKKLSEILMRLENGEISMGYISDNYHKLFKVMEENKHKLTKTTFNPIVF